jgi:hypothetical protein
MTKRHIRHVAHPPETEKCVRCHAILGGTERIPEWCDGPPLSEVPQDVSLAERIARLEATVEALASDVDYFYESMHRRHY